MMFDANITVLGIDIVAPEVDEEGNVEEDSSIGMNLTVGIVLPGPQGVMAMPMGMLRVSMGKDTATDKAEALLAAAELIKDKPKLPSDFVVATGGKQQVEQVAKQVKAVEKMKGSKK